jgi:hypothetical protein
MENLSIEEESHLAINKSTFRVLETKKTDFLKL